MKQNGECFITTLWISVNSTTSVIQFNLDYRIVLIVTANWKAQDARAGNALLLHHLLASAQVFPTKIFSCRYFASCMGGKCSSVSLEQGCCGFSYKRCS